MDEEQQFQVGGSVSHLVGLCFRLKFFVIYSGSHYLST